MAINLSRETFRLVEAPATQHCSCGCRQTISKGQMVYARPQTGRGRGENRILDLEDHYRSWLEKAAHQYAQAQAQVDRSFKEYLGK